MKKRKKYFTRYVLESGKFREIKVRKKEALKDISKILKVDKDFLEIMERM